MPNWFFVAFVLVDVVVMAIVLAVIVSRRGGFAIAPGVQLKDVMALSNEMEQEVESYLKTSWSGDATTLPVAMNTLLDRFEARAREKNLPLTRDVLRPMLGRIVLARRLAKSHEVQEALKQVA